eukprot:1640742-Alexandrium_andersonii.AAC.1
MRQSRCGSSGTSGCQPTQAPWRTQIGLLLLLEHCCNTHQDARKHHQDARKHEEMDAGVGEGGEHVERVHEARME